MEFPWSFHAVYFPHKFPQGQNICHKMDDDVIEYVHLTCGLFSRVV